MIEVYKSDTPLVSIIMATYNRVEYLHRSIDSFFNQTYKNAELIVVDDGSIDDTFSMVNNYIEKHNNIRYIKHSNRKLSLTKNVGITVAVGKYIGFLDSDDEYKANYIQDRVDYLEANTEIDLLEGGVIIIGDAYVKDKNDLSKKIHLSQCHIGATFFGKAEVFKHLEGFNKKIYYSEDSEFWEKATLHYTVKKIDFPGYVYYRDSPDAICNTI